jgi:hypothetical protein
MIPCVNYSDYLNYTLQYNIDIFDNIFILTTPTDQDTIDTIEKYNSKHHNIKTLLTTKFFDYDDFCGKPCFNKGGALNYGLSQIPHEGWLIIGDADIIYPPIIRDIVPTLCIHQMFSMFRYKVFSSEELENYMPKFIEHGANPPPHDFFVQLRNQHDFCLSYIMGYCQIFNFESRFLKIRPPKYVSGRTCRFVDTIFSRTHFPKRHRKMLWNTYCIHLGNSFLNWTGRRSEKFI